MKHGIFLCFLLLFLGCDSDDSLDLRPGELIIYEGESGSVDINGSPVTFHFTDLIMDARCPEDFVCDWDGPAIINVQQEMDTTYLMGLNIGPDRMDSIPNHVIASTYDLHLLEIDCDGGNYCQEEDYFIKIRIDER